MGASTRGRPSFLTCRAPPGAPPVPAPPDAPPRPGPAPGPPGIPSGRPRRLQPIGGGRRRVRSASPAALPPLVPDRGSFTPPPPLSLPPRLGLGKARPRPRASGRAAADSGAGSARGGPRERGRAGEPPASPSDSRLRREPETRARRGLPAPAVDWVGGPPRGRSARERVPCGGGRDAQPSGLGRTPPARGQSGHRLPSPPHLTPIPQECIGSGGPPEGRSTSRRIQVQEMEGCFVLRTWQDASGPGPLGPPAFSPNIKHIPPSGLGLGTAVQTAR